jgi:outer membrane receptor protein involved in Fe transport
MVSTNRRFYGSHRVSWNGIFVEDQWKLRPNLTLNFGLRYDDFGNPSKIANDALDFYPIFLGSGSDLPTQVLNASTREEKMLSIAAGKAIFSREVDLHGFPLLTKSSFVVV